MTQACTFENQFQFSCSENTRLISKARNNKRCSCKKTAKTVKKEDLNQVYIYIKDILCK